MKLLSDTRLAFLWKCNKTFHVGKSIIGLLEKSCVFYLCVLMPLVLILSLWYFTIDEME